VLIHLCPGLHPCARYPNISYNKVDRVLCIPDGDSVMHVPDRVLVLVCHRYLNISNNEVQGALPTLPTALVSVDVSSNKLSGSLPSDMSAYTSLVDIQAGT
jgi:hypothetical protein